MLNILCLVCFWLSLGLFTHVLHKKCIFSFGIILVCCKNNYKLQSKWKSIFFFFLKGKSICLVITCEILWPALHLVKQEGLRPPVETLTNNRR
jgi:hypothetical protein